MRSFKSRLWLVAVLMFVAVSSWAQTLTPTAVPSEDGQFFTENGLKLPVDGDYTWKSLVEDEGLVPGTVEFTKARKQALAYEAAVKHYQLAISKANYEEAIKVAPSNCLKAFAELNHLRALMGGHPDKNGFWTGYEVDVVSGVYSGAPGSYPAIITSYQAALTYVSRALKSGKTHDSRQNDVAKVRRYLQGYSEGILKNVLPSK